MSVLSVLTDIDLDIERIVAQRTRLECTPDKVQGNRGVQQYRYQYFIDIGSAFDDNIDEMITETINSTINWHRTHTKGQWAWSVKDEKIWDKLESGALLFVDIRQRLFISFDLPDDAMLSRMTWQNLKGIRYADCGRLSRKA